MSQQHRVEAMLREALEDAADMLHECALECGDCNYGNGATGRSSDGGVCKECAPIREAERRARKSIATVEFASTLAKFGLPPEPDECPPDCWACAQEAQSPSPPSLTRRADEAGITTTLPGSGGAGNAAPLTVHRGAASGDGR